MAVTDPVADALTVLRNASRARKDVAELRNSKLLEEILKILKKESFIANYKLIKDSKQGLLRVYLKYDKDGSPEYTGDRRKS